jgi:hypothetical protein
MLTLNNLPCLLPTKELRRWFRRYYRLHRDELFARPDNPQAQREPGYAGQFGLQSTPTMPGFTPPAGCALNTLYWPSGATRFGYAVVLMRADDFKTFLDDAWTDEMTLVLGEETDRVEATVRALTPRLITGSGDLYAVPLVDQRYWWQAQPLLTKDGTAAWEDFQPDATWQDVINVIAANLGIQIAVPGDISEDWLGPDWIEFTRKHDNAALLLELVAKSLGRVVVCDTDGTVRLEPSDDAESTLKGNVDGSQLVAGGDASEFTGTATPKKVRVLFRHSFGLRPAAGYYERETEADGDSVADTEKVIYSSAFARVDPTSSDPLNKEALDTLGDKIAEKYYAWLGKSYAYTLPGTVNWQPCGFDDWIEYGLVTTRVRSAPVNLATEWQYQADSAKPVESLLPSQISFLNDTGGTLDIGELVVFDEATQSVDHHGRKLAKIHKPSTTFRRMVGVVTGDEKVETGESGVLTVAGGIVPVLFKSGTPKPGETWGPKPGETEAVKGFPGLTVLSVPDDGSELGPIPEGGSEGDREPIRVMICLVHDVTVLLAKSTSAINASSPSTAWKIYAGTMGSEAETEYTTVPSGFNRGPRIDEAKWMKVSWFANHPEIEPLECSAPV